MANRKFRALMELDPERAAEQLCQAYAAADALWAEVARTMGVSVRTLMRWVLELEVRPRLHRIRREKAPAIALRTHAAAQAAGRQGGWIPGRKRKKTAETQTAPAATVARSPRRKKAS